MRIVCIDTEYDARYTERGVARLACMSYSLEPGHAALVGPAEAVSLWADWVRDDGLKILGHGLPNDVAVLADEHYRRTEGKDCVPGFGWAWEQAHKLYEDNRAIDTETRQRLTQIRFGPHKASVALGSLAKQLFGEDMSDSKDIPDEARAMLGNATPYEEWPPELLDRTPWRVKFGYLLERDGEDPSKWPKAARDYALDDVRLPWRLRTWQSERWNGRDIPDERAQTRHAWMLHVLAIPGCLADRERAQSIRVYYRRVIADCDRTLIDAGILHAPGRKLTSKRGALQALVYSAHDGAPPLTPTAKKKLTGADVATLSPAQWREATATDAKTLVKALDKLGAKITDVDEAAAEHRDGGTLAALQPPTPGAEINAYRVYCAALARAKKADDGDATSWEALAEACLPTLTKAGLVEVSHPRTIKKAKIADYVYAILGNDTPLTDTAAAKYPNPTPRQRRENCSTAAKTVREAILATDSTPLNVVDAVEKSEQGSDVFDAWLIASGQPELNAYAVRSKADKTITNFIDRLDTDNRIRTTYQTLVDTGRVSARGSGVPGTLNTTQLPRDYDKPKHMHVRGCIIPDPGWCFIIADYSQIELCSLAHVLNYVVQWHARDPKRKQFAETLLGRPISEDYESTLAAAINNDQDCHVKMAAVLRGRGESYEDCYEIYASAEHKKDNKLDLTSAEKQIVDDRQLAKPCNFGFPGGLGARSFIDYAAGYGVSIDFGTARKAKDAFMNTWVEMKLYFHLLKRMTDNPTGTCVLTQLYSGRERGGCFFTSGSNGLFQGLAADGAKAAGQLLIDAAYRDTRSPLYGTRPIFFVHDEYGFLCRLEQAERALPEVERLMVAGMREWIPDVKIKAPGKILYDRWGK